MTFRPLFRDIPQPFFSHLEEIRWRLLWCLLSVLILSLFSYRLVEPLLAHMSRVVGPLVFLRPAEAFLARFKISFFLGVFFSVPVFLYHVWRFVGVALTVKERRVILGALPFSYLLFASGAAFAWFLIVPAGLRFLLSFGSSYIQPFLSVGACFEFALWTSMGLGLLFQLPVGISALSYWGLLRAETLRAYRRHAVVVLLALCAILTPSPDVFSQILLFLPTYLLFEISLFMARLLEPKDVSSK